MATRYKPSWTSTVHSLKLRMRSSLFYLSSSHLLMFLTNFNWSSTLRDVKNKNRTNFTPNVLLYRASGKRKNALVFDNSPYSQFQTFYGEWSFIFTVTKYSITQQKKKLYLKIFSCACREVKKKKEAFLSSGLWCVFNSSLRLITRLFNYQRQYYKAYLKQPGLFRRFFFHFLRYSVFVPSWSIDIRRDVYK